MELNEALTGIVYHATPTSNAGKILKNKEFILNPAYGVDAELYFHDKKDKKIFYMSVTRNKAGAYHRGWEDGVVLVLNGDWFNKNYESKAVNYFASGKSTDQLKQYKGEGNWGVTKKGSEYEDRIFASKPIIKLPDDLSKVILEIHVLIQEKNFYGKNDYMADYKETYSELLRIKAEGKIPVYFYGGKLWDNNPETFNYSSAEANEIIKQAKTDWRNLSKRNTTPPRALRELKHYLKNTPSKLVANKWDNANIRSKWLVPFGKRIGNGLPDWLAAERKATSNPKLTSGSPVYDRSYKWRELYYAVKRDALGTLSKETLTFLKGHFQAYLEYGMYSVSTYGKGYYDFNSWQKFMRGRFSSDYSNYRSMTDKYNIHTQTKLLDLIKSERLGSLDGFIDYISKNLADKVEEYVKQNKPQPVSQAKNPWDDYDEGAMSYNEVMTKLSKKKAVNESHQLSRHIIVYHGSNKKFDKFSEKAKRIANDFYGGGIAYTTTDKNVALTYSRAMTYRYGGEEYLYEIQLDLKNLFDVDTVFTGEELKAFLKYIKPEDFARSAGLLGPSEDKYSVLSKLSAGNLSLTGKQVFKGLSKGLVDSSGAESILKRMGYDSLRYNGGDNMGTGKHDVYIPYYENQIKIRKVFKVQRKAVNEEIGHLSFARATLPQIRDQQEFLDHIRLIGSDYDVGMVPAGNLKATQLDGFDDEKIRALRGKKDVDPVIISSDDFILDGHHRWLARKFDDKEVQVIRVYLPILELIRVAMDFYKIDYSEDITEMFAGLKPVLYHNLNLRKLIYCMGYDKLEGRHTHELPRLHINRGKLQGQKQKRTAIKNVKGTSLSRNPNLNYGTDYYFKLELDLNKIKTTNKLHTIDGDLTFFGDDPHNREAEAEYTRTRSMTARKWKGAYDIYLNFGKDDPSYPPPNIEGQFAEEFLEGDLKPLSKYLNAIWIMPDFEYAVNNEGNKHEVVDMIATYAYDHNIPIKLYPSGKDVTADWIDAAAQEEPLVRFAYGPKKAAAVRNISHTLAGVRKSINTNKL